MHDLDRRHGVSKAVRQWDKNGHLLRMRESGRFRYTKEFLLHSTETGHADRYAGLALSLGSFQGLLRAGITEQQVGLDEFRCLAGRLLGDEPRPWHFGYRVRIGIV